MSSGQYKVLLKVLTNYVNKAGVLDLVYQDKKHICSQSKSLRSDDSLLLGFKKRLQDLIQTKQTRSYRHSKGQTKQQKRQSPLTRYYLPKFSDLQSAGSCLVVNNKSQDPFHKQVYQAPQHKAQQKGDQESKRKRKQEADRNFKIDFRNNIPESWLVPYQNSRQQSWQQLVQENEVIERLYQRKRYKVFEEALVIANSEDPESQEMVKEIFSDLTHLNSELNDLATLKPALVECMNTQISDLIKSAQDLLDDVQTDVCMDTASGNLLQDKKDEGGQHQDNKDQGLRSGKIKLNIQNGEEDLEEVLELQDEAESDVVFGYWKHCPCG